jgi:hypothetical protein
MGTISMMKELSRQEDELETELSQGLISPAEYRFHLQELYDDFAVEDVQEPGPFAVLEDDEDSYDEYYHPKRELVCD